MSEDIPANILHIAFGTERTYAPRDKCMTQTILVVDDEAKLRDMIRVYLEQEGYRVVEAGHGREALYVARVEKPDLIILDLMMPEMSGTEFMRAFSKEAETPVIMLTAKVEDQDKILGLELGADDYLTKPFNVRELLARVRAVLRRREAASVVVGAAAGGSLDLADDELLVAGPVQMDVERHTVRVRGELVAFPLKEFELLEMLLRNAGRVLTRGQLIDRIWGSDYVGDTKTLDVHVKRIRARIEVDAGNPALVLTVRGLGYKFADDVEQ